VIQQLLTLARAEPDSAAISSASTDIGKLSRLVVSELTTAAAEKKIDLGAVTPQEPILVCGDADMLHTMISNLLENSVHYTPDGGRADVTVGINEGLPYLEVNDTGPGIPVDERLNVFDRFYRCSATSEPGTGLGLAIVKAIAERLGAMVNLGESSLGGLLVRVNFSGKFEPSINIKSQNLNL